MSPPEPKEFLPGVPDWSTVHEPSGDLFKPITVGVNATNNILMIIVLSQVVYYYLSVCLSHFYPWHCQFIFNL